MTGTSGEVIMPISLPDKVQVTELTYSFHDASPTFDLILGLCEVRIGTSAALCAKWIVDTTGVNTTDVTTRTLTGSPLLTVDNTNNAYFLIGNIRLSDPGFGIVSARIGYQLQSYLPAVTR